MVSQVYNSEKIGLEKYLEQACRIDLNIQQAIQPGTILICRGMSATFDVPVRGPLSFAWEPQTRQLIYRTSSSGDYQAISNIARVNRV